MNLVLETERQSEAKLIDARKSAEAAMIKAKGEQESIVARLEADRAFADLLANSPALLASRNWRRSRRFPRNRATISMSGSEI